jgi:hypothetical protein
MGSTSGDMRVFSLVAGGAVRVPCLLRRLVSEHAQGAALPEVDQRCRGHSPCSLGFSATSQQNFSLGTKKPPATSQEYFSLKTNQPPANSRSTVLLE